nr:MAG: RNA-dependent RNA polymerase [Riboviria sp.]
MERITFSFGPKTRTYAPALDSKLRPNELNQAVSLIGLPHVPLSRVDFYAPGSLRRILPSQYETVSPRFNDDMALDENPPCYRNYAAEWLDVLPNKSKYVEHDYLINYGRQIQTIYSEKPFMMGNLRVTYDSIAESAWTAPLKREGDDSVFDSLFEKSRLFWPTRDPYSFRKGLLTNLVSYTPETQPMPVDGRPIWEHLDYWTTPELYFELPYTGEQARGIFQMQPWRQQELTREMNHPFRMRPSKREVFYLPRKNQGLPGDSSSFDKVLEKENTPPQNYQFEPSSINDQAINPTWYQSAAEFDRLAKDWTDKKNQVKIYGDDSISAKIHNITHPVPICKDDRALKRERQVKIRTFREKCDDLQTRKKVARCHKIHDAINQSFSSWNPLDILKDLLAPLAERFKNFMEGMTVVEWFGDVKQKFNNTMEEFALKIHEQRAFLSVWMANLIMGHHDASSFFMSIMTFISVMMPWVINGTAELLVKLISEVGSWTASKFNQGSGFNLSKVFATFYGLKVPKNLFTDIVAKLRSLSAFSKGIKDGFGMLKWIGKAFERFRVWCGIGNLKGQYIPGTEYELTQWATDISELSEMTSVDMQEPQNKDLLKKVITAAAAITKHGILEGYPAKCQIWIKASVTTVEQLSRTYHQQLRMIIPSLRPAPMWISFSGPPGVGKSLMINRMGRALLHPKANAPIKRLIDPENLFYFCNTATKYDDQYRNQPIFVIDDIFQMKSNDNMSKEESEAMMMINAVGPVPCEVNNSQAGLKGGIALSELYFTTSNITFPTPPEIKDVRALHRRVAVRCWVDVNKSVPYGPAALKYYVLPSVLARSEQGKFLELDDNQEIPVGYQLMTESSWEASKYEILRHLEPMNEQEFIKYTLSVWKRRVEFSATNSFNDAFADDYFDGPAPVREKITPLRKPILTTPDVRDHKNQGKIPLSVKFQMVRPLINVMTGCYLIGSASHHYNPLNEQVSLILGAVMLITFIWEFMVPFINILRNQGGYSHDKNTVARATPRVRAPQIVTWKNNGNLSNTRDQIRQMCVKLTLRCGELDYSFSGLAYGGRDILVNDHCLGILYDHEDEHVTIEVTNYQNFTREYAIKKSMVLESDSDLSVLRIPDMPQMKMRDHLFCEVLPDHGTQLPVATYCMRTQTFSHSQGKMFATAPNNIPKSEPPPIGAQFFTADVYDCYYCHFITVSNAEMKPGDCGSPVIDVQSGKIMGIHVATTGTTDDYVPFTRSHLPPVQSFDMPDTEIVERGQNNGVLSEHVNYVSRKTNLRPSIIQGTFPIKKAPASLSRHHPNGDPLWNNFEKGFKGNKPYPIDDVDFAVEFVSSKVKTYEASPLGRRELSDFETLNGMNGVYNGMILSTSMGTPYKEHALKSGKYDAIDMVDGVRRWSNTPLSFSIQARIDEVEKDLLQGKIPCEYMTEQLKDEAVTLKKVEIGKTRTFRTLSIVMNYLYRKYFGAMVAAIEQNPDMQEVALGLNAHGHHWTRLYHRLNKFGGKVLAGDYENWDRSLSSQLINTLKKICTAFYGYDSKARDALIDYLFSAPVIVENLVFFPFQGLPSGVAMTTLFGSLINFVVIILAIAHILRKEGKLYLLTHENIETTFYGDDHIVAMHPALQEYVNFQTVRAFMTKHGLGYTPADKSDRVFDFEGLQEVPYLKRTFKPIAPMMIQAPLELDSIENMVQWQDRRLSEMEFVKAVWTSICQESVYHGTEKFSEITQKVQNRIFSECDARGWQRPVLNADYRHWYGNWIASRI